MEKKSQTTAAVFADYQKSRTGHMRYTLAQKNIVLLHALDRPLRILDAAGGNGLNTQWLARQGHSVTLLDADPLMLKQAEQRLAEENLLDRCQFVNGAIERAAELLPHEQFDLVLCHHIVEYLRDPCHLFRELHKVCTATGELSLVTLNPVSEAIRAVVFSKNPALAHSRIVDLSYDAKWFGQATLYSLDQILGWAKDTSWTVADFRGIRVLADYIHETEYDDAKEQEVLRLEEELACLEPYRRIGRYLQFCFKKQPN